MLRISILAALLIPGVWSASAADLPNADFAKWVASQGGFVTRGSNGKITEVSLARTSITDNDMERLMDLKDIQRLDLSFTYVTDAGIEHLQQFHQLEDFTCDTCEFITDAAIAYLRGNKALHRLVLRGTDITDVSLPYIADLTNLRTLDISYTMLGDVGLESLPALTQLEDLNIGGTRISGINLSMLKLLPKLKRLSFNGIQRRNAGACWSPLINDLDMDTVSLLAGLEDLDLGVGVSLGRGGKPIAINGAAANGGNCSVAGGIKISDLGLAKIANLKKLRRLNVSGAKLTPAGLKVLEKLPQLERLSVWYCTELDDSAATVLAGVPSLVNVDLSYTGISDEGLHKLAALPHLKYLYLTDTKVTADAAQAFRKDKPSSFISWARRPDPRPIPEVKPAAAEPLED
jgi:Leucine-rich repeat (LRR) protein